MQGINWLANNMHLIDFETTEIRFEIKKSQQKLHVCMEYPI